MSESDDARFAKRALAASAIAVGMLAAAATVWYTSYFLAPMLIGALFGIFVHELSGCVARITPLRGRWSVGVTLVLLLCLLLVASYLIGKRVADEFSQLFDMLPQGMEAVRHWLSQNPKMHSALRSMTSAGGASLTAGARHIGQMLKVGFGFGAAVFTAFFTGVFLAFNPEFYSDAVCALVPAPQRAKTRRLLADLWRSLWLWMLGRLLIMAAIAVGHMVAYRLLGVPLPIALGLIAGAFSFIPFIGPVAATIPAGLIALTVSPSLALWVIVVHGLVEMIESHVLTPLTQKYMVDVPALVTIGSFLALGGMMGVMGVVIATPLAAVSIVLVRHLYIEGALGADQVS